MYDLPFDLMVRRATADIADALTAPPPAPPAPGAPPGMGAPPPGMPPQGVPPQGVPPQGVPPQGVPPQPALLPKGGLSPQVMAMLQPGAPPRSFKRGGSVSSGPADMTEQYNTDLSPEDEARFQVAAKGRMRDLADYDLRGAFKAKVMPTKRGQHGTDQFKKPSHPTFSDESQYDTGTGGRWGREGDRDTFTPGPGNMKTQQLRQYFEEREPNAKLIEPQRFAAGGGAWTRKEGKNPEGGLNAKGRASLKAQGHDIKPPVSAKLAAKSPKAAARRKSFCSRMSGMPGAMKDEQGRPTRKALSLRKWDC